MRQLLLLAALLIVTACSPIRLAPVEVREYNGQMLDSSDDFRENSIRGPQRINTSQYILTIDGLVQSPMTLRYDQALGYPHYEKAVSLLCVEGWHATILWEGVRIRDLIDAAEPLPEATIVIFHAADGYTSSLALDYIRDKDILLAYKMNNVTLAPERGYPFQVVAEDRWGYKWAKWVTRIELSDNASYHGYWERRGYSNDAEITKPFR